MTNNTNKQDVLDLFQDNVTNDISAADTRVFIENVYSSKEEVITKIAFASSLAATNTNIYEGSLVVIYNDGTNTGLYLSTINQPTVLTDLIKISS